MSKFRDQAFFIQYIWFAMRNIRDTEVLANLAKFSRSRIKVGLQYVKDGLTIGMKHQIPIDFINSNT
jgi:hypothetical protein